MATFLFYEDAGVVFEKRGHYSGFWGHVFLTWVIIGDLGTGGMKKRWEVICMFFHLGNEISICCLFV